ncbi:MAG: DUF59 domain-containing protein [Chloroflexi bacterium]|nr:DUF59 domain-containing protein [Chloroflexota bacterium]
MPVTEAVMDALKECYDPEIPVNIVDLGLVYGVETEGGKVIVRMTLTAPGCPLHSFITEEVKSRLLKVEGVEEAEVQMVWEPRWSPARMTEEGKKALGIFAEVPE